MEYTIKKLGELAGVSTRTLRYYDELGLLKPSRVSEAGYRIYGPKEVDLLQQIMFYKSMDLKLEEIQKIVMHPDYDINKSLIAHHQKLLSKRAQLDQLILTVEKTIAHHKGEIEMLDKEKFEGFKKEKLAENEAKYGKEIREKYGKDTIENSNKKFLNLNEEDFNKMQEVEDQMFEALIKVSETKDLTSANAKKVYENHREWLSFTWPSYTKAAHIGLAEMYIADERFASYYNNRAGKEVVTTLRDIIIKYAH